MSVLDRIPKRRQESKYKRLSRIYYNRMFPRRHDALEVAWSVFVGVFIGVSPTFGVAIIMTVATCALFKLPKVPGVIADFVANPVTQFGFFYPAGYALGCAIVQPEAISFDFLKEFEQVSWSNFGTIMGNLWHNASGHLFAFLVGIEIIATITGFIFFFIAYFVVGYRKKKWLAAKTGYIHNLIAEDEVLIKETRNKGKKPMMHIYPFKALRPVDPAEAKNISALPYDVMNRAEAKEMAQGLPHSYLRVTRSELELDDSLDAYDPKVYAHARENLDKMIADGVIAHDKKDCLYIYRQTMNGREQYGLVCCVPAEDYFNGTIKKHELTRADKEEDRLRHVLGTNANTGPVFLTYRDEGQFALLADVIKTAPTYDFVTEADGFGHTVWVIEDDAKIAAIRKAFEAVPVSYIADGHHRSAAGARAASYRAEEAKKAGTYTGEEEFNRYLAILFPSTQLKILDYNRVLKSLNGRTPEQLMAEMEKVFDIAPLAEMQSPAKQNQVNFYMGGKWYACTFKAEYLQNLGPVDSLDVALLQKLILKPLFDVDDPRTSKNIDFVGGIRGLGELVKRVDSGECACAFAMYPTTLDQLMNIADAGEIMPPKSTWFEPKLRDGLLVHTLD
ncbi:MULTISPECIES: DUF1015 family protein [unclassified Fibrobacter]|uniref:DUF1015 family protein n=1 Tax=unclassified Fibrobacter TaxID=2634177 RepID=UPI000917278F|nr:MULTISPECIES: DUF1015 family protein [unclassified Fibrobacter]OWV05357.1 hypothetical protein B7993_08780 [Fibrobacter sp. UWH3]SHL27063.1 Uncharacterized conserved protein, DUF1015 family [Fibrobacter sp. UWH6]